MSTFKFTSVPDNNYLIDIYTKRGKINKFSRLGFSYYQLFNNEQYTIHITNNNPTRCDAHIWINKQKLCIMRINPYQTIIVNKNLIYNSNKYLSKIYNNINGLYNGLIKITFTPEATNYGYSCIADYTNSCSNFHKTSFAATGPKGENGILNNDTYKCLFGISNKLHNSIKKKVPLLTNIDPSRTISIYCRIIDA